MTHPQSRTLPTVFFAFLLTVGVAPALENPTVRTEAGFFQSETVERANAILQSIKEDFGKDVVVETFASVPEHSLKDVKKMTSRRMARWFHDWAQERSDMLGVDGVFILLCKQPPFAAVVVSDDLAERGFSDTRRAAIARQLPTSGWASRSSDRKFLDALEQTRKEIVLALQSPARVEVKATPPLLLVAYLAGGILALFFVVLVVFAIARTLQSPPGGSQYVAPTSPLPSIVTAPSLDELQRRAEALTHAPHPPYRPDEKTLTHPGPGGEGHRDV